jgi:hypothetical protein
MALCPYPSTLVLMPKAISETLKQDSDALQSHF